MPAAQRTVGISSSVAVFLLITAICCVLSLSSRELHDLDDDNCSSSHTTNIVVSSYVPNNALICVMLTGIIAMIIFVCKKGELTASNSGCELTRRHELHRKYSFYSIAIFFVGVCTLDMNYLLVEFFCISNWFDCRHIDKEYFRANVVLIIFHTVGMAFAFFEIVVCWMIRNVNFNRSQLVWHLLAVVQAANITVWFHSLLTEAYNRIEARHHSIDAYFSFCDNATLSNDTFMCDKSSIVTRWFLISAPVLFPVTIEFNILVIETLLDRSRLIEPERDNFIENTQEGDDYEENEDPDEGTPLLHGQSNTETNLIGSKSKIFTSIFVIVNVVYLLLSVVVFLGCKYYKLDNQLKYFNDIYTVFKSVYHLFLISCSVVGMISSMGLKRQQHTHISFLEYILLFAMSGVLFQSVKRIVAFSVNRKSSAIASLVSAYYMTDLLDLIQVTSQTVFYYYVKDVKPQLSNTPQNQRLRPTSVCSPDNASPVSGHDEHFSRAQRRSVDIFKNIIFIMAIGNFVKWIIDSFLYPDMMAYITPTKDYVIDSWPVFDNVMIPIYIFFRYNSAMLFWCIHKKLSRPGQHHQRVVAPIQRSQPTACSHRYVDDALVSDTQTFLSKQSPAQSIRPPPPMANPQLTEGLMTYR